VRVAVVVIGDIGRSPRMSYHAGCLADRGDTVDLIGYLDSELPPFLNRREVTVHALRRDGSTRAPSSRMRYVLAAGLRGLRLLVELTRLLLRIPAPDVVLVQTPPAVPVLAVATLAARLRKARLVIDWHNLTSAMLALRVGQDHRAVSLVDRYERALARRADGHLFVSMTMSTRLQPAWGISGRVFADHPAEQFVPLSAVQRQRHRDQLLQELDVGIDEGRALIVISPTSWTLDEDMTLLGAAAIRVDALMNAGWRSADEPRELVIIVTGRGARRESFERWLAQAALTRVRIRTVWLSADAYPASLACADLGLSLHRSASGLDLPMKVLDLFGAGVPVAALDYGPCLRELVRDGENGWLFDSSEALAVRLTEACDRPECLRPLLEGVRRASAVSWRAAWQRDAEPLIRDAAARPR
jgi:beta-1,4-mannosyltransferase